MMTETAQMLDIKNLHARLADGREILRGIDLSVHRGEVHAIFSPPEKPTLTARCNRSSPMSNSFSWARTALRN
jgi:hypothetical protein